MGSVRLFGRYYFIVRNFVFSCAVAGVEVVMPRNRISFTLWLLFACSTGFVFAAQNEPKKPDYSKESAIVTSTETHLRYAADGTSVRTQGTSVKVLSEAGVRAWGVLAFGYADGSEHLDIHYVRVRKTNGTTVSTPLENVLDLPSDVTRAAPMYSDLKQKQIPVKALGVGDTLEFEIAYTEDKPLVPGQFWYSYPITQGMVVLKETVELRVPHDKQPKIADAGLKPVIIDDGPERVYTWTTSHTDPTAPTGTGASTGDKDNQSIQFSTFASWQQVGDWYSKLAQPQAKVTPEIQAKADALVKGISSESEKIQAIYDFVSSHIRYISLSFGIGRYQPHSAAEVLENEYGDCKDKHTLLAALLKAEGIDAWPVLIHSTQKLDETVPSPGQFDHVITAIPQGKQMLWLDTTPKVAPFAMLFSTLRDKQALIMPSTSASYLIKTPANPPFPAEDRFNIRGELNSEGTFKGHGELTLRSDSEVIYRAIFHASSQAKWQDVMQAISYQLGFGGEVSNVQIDDPDNTRKPFHLSWDYERKKYGDWDNRQITPPTPGIPINMIDEDKKPESAIQAGTTGVSIYTAELTLPAGTTMEAPANVDLKTDFAEYHAKYLVANGKFSTERKTILLKREVPVEDWQKYVAFEKQIKDDYGHFSLLTSPTVEAAKNDSQNNPEAAKLIDAAMQDFQNHSMDAAEDKLDKARRLSPNQTNLNAAYGSLYMMQGKMEEGIDATRKELKLHPDNLSVARWLAQMLTRIKRDNEAIEVYRTVLKTAPDDRDATSEIARILVEKKDWLNAQPMVEAALKLRPDNAQVQVWYGQSCLHTGKDAEGVKALTAAAEASSDPAMLSAIASALTDVAKAPDVAEKTARRAVQLIEERTAELSLEDISTAQVKEVADLAQVWDVMSRTAFKAGDLALAEKYAQAAWMLAQEPAAGDHLAQIYEKQGKNAQALDTYRLATGRAFPPVEGLDERISSLEKRLGHSNPSSGYNTDRLQKMRIVHMTRIKPVSASATFLILLTNGKVTEVKMLGGNSALDPYEALLKQAKFNTVFPDDGPERIVRQGILSCSVYDPSCMFMMMLPADATATAR